jgi:malonate decarboxylase alpha subunit
MVQSVLALPEHLDLFENGIASKLDFSFSGPQGARLAQLASAGRIAIGAIHTYLELFARYFVDLTPNVALICAQAADRDGNLYTGANTEDTPAIVEATAFKSGIVIAQVNEIVDAVPRVDIPAGWVDFVVQSPLPHFIEPLFTRDPAQISEVQVLMAMMAIKGIYAEYGVQRLNHGIGFDTAAIELLLPTYGEALGLKGRICQHWALNPHPALIPAIEAGWVRSVHSFGSEMGMEDYIRARPDVFFTGADGSMRSNRAFCQAAGHYACDLFIGSTLQIDLAANSSTATLGRIAGFGGAPNMGADARGRRHASTTWLKAGRQARQGLSGARGTPRGQKLVVQMVETFREHMQPAFVERLDAWTLAEQADMPLPPIMIYGEDVTHILTEEGIANRLLCRSDEEREQAVRGVAGYTAVGLGRDRAMVENLRDRGVIQRPEDIGVDPRLATRNLLAARSMRDLVDASGGLYAPPSRFRNW